MFSLCLTYHKLVASWPKNLLVVHNDKCAHCSLAGELYFAEHHGHTWHRTRSWTRYTNGESLLCIIMAPNGCRNSNRCLRIQTQRKYIFLISTHGARFSKISHFIFHFIFQFLFSCANHFICWLKYAWNLLHNLFQKNPINSNQTSVQIPGLWRTDQKSLSKALLAYLIQNTLIFRVSSIDNNAISGSGNGLAPKDETSLHDYRPRRRPITPISHASPVLSIQYIQ